MTNDPPARTPADQGGQPPPASKSLIERVLAPIADVRRGEAAGALLLMVTMFLILSAYYLLKTAREIFILSEGGAEVKSYSSAGQAILLLVLVPLYGAFASRVGRVQLTQWVTLFFVLHIFLFMAALRAGLHIGIPYFLWVGIFNLMVIAQFWAFANDIYTPEQGKRLFPLIGVGSSLGAWIGSVRAGQLVGTMGPSRLLIGAAGTLVICALLPRVIDRITRRGREGETTPSRAAAPATADGPPIGGPNGFAMIFGNRYLLLIALLTILLNVVNTSGEYLFSRYVVDTANATYGTGAHAAAAREQFIGGVYSRLFSTVNLLGFLLQMFVVSRLFAWLGIGGSLFVHPVVAFSGYLMMLRAPSIQTMGWLKVLDNSIDYSLGNTTKQALWLPTSREAKYKAKQAVDSFFVRAGDVIQAGLVFLGERLAFAVPAFAAINLVLVGLWLAVVVALNGFLRPAKTGEADRLQTARGI
jgi:AAA family ATP:ADP antiporter